MNMNEPSILFPMPIAPQPALCGADIWKRRSVEDPFFTVESAKPSLEEVS